MGALFGLLQDPAFGQIDVFRKKRKKKEEREPHARATTFHVYSYQRSLIAKHASERTQPQNTYETHDRVVDILPKLLYFAATLC
jgi:hypothetical protein